MFEKKAEEGAPAELAALHAGLVSVLARHRALTTVFEHPMPKLRRYFALETLTACLRASAVPFGGRPFVAWCIAVLCRRPVGRRA